LAKPPKGGGVPILSFFGNTKEARDEDPKQEIIAASVQN
jgi:hypothetical protein